MRTNIPTRTDASEPRAAGVLDLLLGIWVLISPFVLGFRTGSAVWNNVIVGVILIVLSGIHVSRFSPALGWINFCLGLWLIISGFVLGAPMNPAFFWNQVVSGIVVAIVSIWSTVGRPATATPLA